MRSAAFVLLVLQPLLLHCHLRLHIDYLGFRAHEPAALDDVQHRVHTAMVPDLQLELSISRCQLPDFSTSCVLSVNNVFVSVEFLHARCIAAQGTHLLPGVRVTASRVSQSLLDDFQQSPASSTFQLLQSWRLFLACFQSSTGHTWYFSIFLPWLLCPQSLRALEDSHRRLAVRSLCQVLTASRWPLSQAPLGMVSVCSLLSGTAWRWSFFCNANSWSFTSLSSVRRAKTRLCNPWSSWSFCMSSTETSARECNTLSCVPAASCAHSPLPRSVNSGSAAVIKTAWRLRASRFKASSCYSAWGSSRRDSAV